MFKVFWREKPFSKAERDLWDAVAVAHEQSVARVNLSTTTLLNCSFGSCDYVKAIAGALMTLGGQHAPIVQTAVLLSNPDPAAVARNLIEAKATVPGWGNSFVKGKIDPMWQQVDAILSAEFREIAGRIAEVTQVLHEAGKEVYPNPSAYTAALAIAVGLPCEFSPWILISGRLDAWTEAVWRSAHA